MPAFRECRTTASGRNLQLDRNRPADHSPLRAVDPPIVDGCTNVIDGASPTVSRVIPDHVHGRVRRNCRTSWQDRRPCRAVEAANATLRMSERNQTGSSSPLRVELASVYLVAVEFLAMGTVPLIEKCKNWDASPRLVTPNGSLSPTRYSPSLPALHERYATAYS